MTLSNTDAVVIVGGSIAGVTAATALRDHGHAGAITIIETDPNLPYERPPLSKALETMGELVPIQSAEAYAARDIELLLGRRAVALHAERRHVELDDGTALPADAVLLATGVAARRLEVEGRGLINILTLRDAADAAMIGARLRTGTGPIVIIGGGFIGLEAAAVARELGREVTVVEALPMPLLPALGDQVAPLVRELHEQRGVRILAGVTVARFVGETEVSAVELADGTVLPAETVIVGVGVVPNDEIARDAGVASAGGVIVDADGRTNHPWVWAAGDVTAQETPFTVGRQRIEHWEVAKHHGAAVAAAMIGVDRPAAEAPYFWSEQYGLRLQMYGRAMPTDEVVLREGANPEDFLAFWLREGRLVAAAGMQQPKELRAAKAIIEARVAVDAADLRSGTPLRALLKAATVASA